MAIELKVNTPFEYFTDAKGKALENGKIYIGQANLEPISNPISVYSDSELTELIAQPIRTIGGHPVAGSAFSPIKIFTDEFDDYSILVADKNDNLVYSSLNKNDFNVGEFLNIEQLKNIDQLAFKDNAIVNILGYYSEGDGGGGQFYWDSSSIEVDDGGMVIKSNNIETGRWKRLIHEGRLSVKHFGAKGDDATNDTVSVLSAVNFALSEGVQLYFPKGAYLCNLNLTSTVVNDENKLHWTGDYRATTLKPFDALQSCVIINPVNYLSRISVKNMSFEASSLNANVCAFWAEAVHFSSFEFCRFVGGNTAFRMRGFGNKYESCIFGDASTYYGFMGIGNNDSYAGFNQFYKCEFKASKIAYAVDNAVSPAVHGHGNKHVLSDWEGFSGLAIFIRAQSGLPETFESCWWEVVGVSGNVDLTDFPFQTLSIATLEIPPSSTYISTAAVGAGEKPSKVIFRGSCNGLTAKGDIWAEVERTVEGNFLRDASTPNSNFDVSISRSDEFPNSEPASFINAKVKTLDNYQGIISSKTQISKSDHKTALVYGELKNLWPGLAYDGSSGFITDSNVVTTVVDDGLILGKSLNFQIPSGEGIYLTGTDGVGSRRIIGYESPSCGSFALKSSTGGDVEMSFFVNYGDASGIKNADIPLVDRWETWKWFTSQQAYLIKLTNNGVSTLNLSITDFQVVKGTRPEVVSFSSSNMLSGAFYDDSIFFNRANNVFVTTFSASHADGLKTLTLQDKLNQTLIHQDRTFGDKDIYTGLALGSRLLIGGSLNNGNFQSWTAGNLDGWTKSGNINALEETVDLVDGTSASLDLQSNPDGYLELNSNVAGASKVLRVSAWVKKISGTGDLLLKYAPATDSSPYDVLASDRIDSADWRWVSVATNTSDYASGVYLKLALFTTNSSRWLISDMKCCDMTGKERI